MKNVLSSPYARHNKQLIHLSEFNTYHICRVNSQLIHLSTINKLNDGKKI